MGPARRGRRPQPLFTFLRLLILILFLILTIQLVRLQVLQGADYQQRAAINALREIQIPAARGLIYDRNGQPLVQNKATFAAAVIPGHLPAEGQQAIYRQLQRILGVPAAEIAQSVDKHLASENPFTPVVIKKDLDQQTAYILAEMEPHLPGAKLIIEATRSYTAGELTAHVLGYVGKISKEEYEALKGQGYLLNDRIGKTGVELTYEELLRGKPGKKLIEVDAAGQELRVIAEKQPRPGANLVLSLDLGLQQKVAEVLQEYMGASENAAAAVMDVHTGELLALVSLPTFDNNIFASTLSEEKLAALTNAPGKPLVNHAIAEMYPPGSTFKTIVGAAALQEGVATPDTTIVSRGYITVANQFDPNVVYVFKDWAALGALDFYGGIAMSSDVYFYYLAGGKADEGFQGLGEERLARYARLFGLGEPTGIDLPTESAGLVPDAQWKEAAKGESWYVGDTYNFGIGQGDVALTPLQLLNAVAAIANGGELLRPHLVREVQDTYGKVIQRFAKEVRREIPIDDGYLSVVREAMRQSVVKGVASKAAVPGLQVAGKTGTAEFGPPRFDGSHDTHGWFVGFAPFADPQIAIVVFVQRGSGGFDAAPAAAEILKYYFGASNGTPRPSVEEP